MTKISKKISKHPILNTDRAIRLKQISYIDFDLMEARVIWEEVFLDATGEEISDDTVINRTIALNLSNSNVVDAQGVIINETTHPKLLDEEDEVYQARLQAAKDAGFPEFDFYAEVMLNKTALEGSISMLDGMKRYNRK